MYKGRLFAHTCHRYDKILEKGSVRKDVFWLTVSELLPMVSHLYCFEPEAQPFITAVRDSSRDCLFYDGQEAQS